MQYEPTKAVILTLALAILIGALMLMPSSSSVVIPMPVPYADKLYHFAAFASLAVPIAFYCPRWLLTAVLSFAAFGALIEIVQPYVGRECSVLDWVADLMGIAAGVAAGRAANSLTRRQVHNAEARHSSQ